MTGNESYAPLLGTGQPFGGQDGTGLIDSSYEFGLSFLCTIVFDSGNINMKNT